MTKRKEDDSFDDLFKFKDENNNIIDLSAVSSEQEIRQRKYRSHNVGFIMW